MCFGELGDFCVVFPEEHSSTQEPHPLGNPLHLPLCRKQEPMFPPVLTWQEFSKHVTSHLGGGVPPNMRGVV